MAHRLSAGLSGPAFWIAAGGMLWSATVGIALAVQLPVGLVLLLAPAYGLILFANLSLALVLWVPLVFLDSTAALNAAGKAAGLLIALIWLGSLRSLTETAIAALRRHRLLLATLAALIAWLTFSLAWSTDPGRGLADLWRWYVLGVLFLVVLTTATFAQLARMILAAFVVGALASVVIGVLNGGLSHALNGGARFAGIGGDPNVLAAGLLPATVLAAAFLPDARSPLLRAGLIGAIVLLVAGFLATGSRGGSVAAVATIIVAFFVFSRRRAQVVAVAAVILGVAAVTLVSAPQTWDRLTNYKDDNGRSDLRTVAWRMGQHDPVTGVGINNFEVHSPEYVREPGALQHVGLIVDEPHLVHNTYLQLFAENGIIGLALFLGVVAGCLRAAKLAGDRFDAQRRRSLATLARAVLVATIGMLAADLSLSAATDTRLWLLLAMGPALLTVATSAGSDRRGERWWAIEGAR